MWRCAVRWVCLRLDEGDVVEDSRPPLEFERGRRRDSAGTRADLNGVERAGTDLLVQVTPADQPVVGQFSYRNILSRMCLEIVDVHMETRLTLDAYPD
jgi:hypothetical protein